MCQARPRVDPADQLALHSTLLFEARSAHGHTRDVELTHTSKRKTGGSNERVSLEVGCLAQDILDVSSGAKVGGKVSPLVAYINCRAEEAPYDLSEAISNKDEPCKR